MALSGALEALAGLRQRLAEVAQIPGKVALAVAPRIEMKAREDMTTSSGRVPPVVVTSTDMSVTVVAPPWFIENRVDAEGYIELALEEASRAWEETFR